MRLSLKPRFSKMRRRGYVTSSFCDGKFSLTENERVMYRVFGRLYKRAGQHKKSALH